MAESSRPTIESGDASALRKFAASLGGQLSVEAARQLVAYLDAMLDENTRVNLTAVRERDAAMSLHAADSLAAVALPDDVREVLDLGTGNGFPGIAVACLRPSAEVTLMDRTQKKVAAIERALAASGMDPRRVNAFACDAAQAPSRGLRRTFDAITARAVGNPVEVARLAAPLLRRDGFLLLWLAQDTDAQFELPGRLRQVRRLEYQLPAPAERTRRVVLYGMARG